MIKEYATKFKQRLFERYTSHWLKRSPFKQLMCCSKSCSKEVRRQPWRKGKSVTRGAEEAKELFSCWISMGKWEVSPSAKETQGAKRKEVPM